MKFVIVTLFAIVLVANVKMIHMNELERSDEPAYSEVAEDTPGAADSQTIPMTQRACDNGNCAHICAVLGFSHGICVSATTCQCSN